MWFAYTYDICRYGFTSGQIQCRCGLHLYTIFVGVVYIKTRSLYNLFGTLYLFLICFVLSAVYRVATSIQQLFNLMLVILSTLSQNFARADDKIAIHDAEEAGYTIGHNAFSHMWDSAGSPNSLYTRMLGTKLLVTVQFDSKAMIVKVEKEYVRHRSFIL